VAPPAASLFELSEPVDGVDGAVPPDDSDALLPGFDDE
jgi:hypothetical protein